MTATPTQDVAVCESCLRRPATATVVIAGAEERAFLVCSGCTPTLAEGPTFRVDAPPLGWSGLVRMREPLRTVIATLTLIGVPPVAAFTTFVVTGSPLSMVLAGLAGLLLSVVVDHRRRPRLAKVLREVPTSSQDGQVIQRRKRGHLWVVGREFARAIRLFGPLFVAVALMGLLMTLTEGSV